MPNPSDRPIDYAAIARSVMKPSGQKPAWLVEGQTIYAPSHAQGIGKITAILGDRLLAKFPNYSVPVIITNWQEAIYRQEILPAHSQEIISEITREQEIYDVSEEEIVSFGGHFANLMCRLRLAVDRLEGNSDRIQYVLATATIGNLIELTERITERRERLVYINRSGARTAGRTILCLNLRLELTRKLVD